MKVTKLSGDHNVIIKIKNLLVFVDEKNNYRLGIYEKLVKTIVTDKVLFNFFFF
jgi:hypothetical protein